MEIDTGASAKVRSGLDTGYAAKPTGTDQPRSTGLFALSAMTAVGFRIDTASPAFQIPGWTLADPLCTDLNTCTGIGAPAAMISILQKSNAGSATICLTARAGCLAFARNTDHPRGAGGTTCSTVGSVILKSYAGSAAVRLTFLAGEKAFPSAADSSRITGQTASTTMPPAALSLHTNPVAFRLPLLAGEDTAPFDTDLPLFAGNATLSTM